MSEPDQHPSPDSPDSGATAGSSPVADVLASLETLADRPVVEHVAVFEQAHEQLRRALEPRHG